jgi:hypothetical protein
MGGSLVALLAMTGGTDPINTSFIFIDYLLRNCLNFTADFFIVIFRWILFFLLAGLAG